MQELSLYDGIKYFWFFTVIFPLVLGGISFTIEFFTRGRSNPNLFVDFQHHLWGIFPQLEMDRTRFAAWFTLIVFHLVGGGLLLGTCKYIIEEGFPLISLVPVGIILGVLFIRFLFDVQHSLSINSKGRAIRIDKLEKELNELKKGEK